MNQLNPDSPEMRQFIFALQCKLAVDSFEMLSDYSQGGFGLMGTNAKEAFYGRFRGVNKPMIDVIRFNFKPMLGDTPLPMKQVLSKKWDNWNRGGERFDPNDV